MALEHDMAQQYRECPDKYMDPHASYQMTTRDYTLRPSADAVSGAIVITLPPVAEATGRFYSIISRMADAVNTITVQDKNDSECWGGDVVFDTRCDRAIFYSDGLAWLALAVIDDNDPYVPYQPYN